MWKLLSEFIVHFTPVAEWVKWFQTFEENLQSKETTKNVVAAAMAGDHRVQRRGSCSFWPKIGVPVDVYHNAAISV